MRQWMSGCLGCPDVWDPSDGERSESEVGALFGSQGEGDSSGRTHKISMKFSPDF